MDNVDLTAGEAAEYLGLSESYLAKLRMGTGLQVGPSYLKVGLRAVRYRRADLDAWMDSKSCGQHVATRSLR
ncbi:AlpA family transcriptional regulator [Tropicibacter sp. Alg240-R139]|uniref:helix-turn-helix transcriptional regulator n=1 Tax=Tropicibacter sp. Alg240-R139 TaxID=2305991 RepID=UPI0013E05074|nr:helix-turn-helix domain-containing protein [Tropicibacter sp. Alg240-R139]